MSNLTASYGVTPADRTTTRVGTSVSAYTRMSEKERVKRKERNSVSLAFEKGFLRDTCFVVGGSIRPVDRRPIITFLFGYILCIYITYS